MYNYVLMNDWKGVVFIKSCCGSNLMRCGTHAMSCPHMLSNAPHLTMKSPCPILGSDLRAAFQVRCAVGRRGWLPLDIFHRIGVYEFPKVCGSRAIGASR